MAHQSLYRKYRPAVFDEMVGQQHIERTLRNAVASDSVSHAYLFTGPRGTGKTTSARLLAKALLCESGPTPAPDGDCPACVEIAEGRHPDVIELDAASRNGVEAVRSEIIDRVAYAPQRGRYKVYIIDEVHMLSGAAFNAMLKTLEEPPEHVVFILCTTDPQKVPETIQSRCQRFDFHPLSADEIVARLTDVAGKEGITLEPGSAALMAQHSEGGMRDALTTLEQVAAFTDNNITVQAVEDCLGEVSLTAFAELVGAVARRDTPACFTWVAGQIELGADLPELVRGLLRYLRDVYVLALFDESRLVLAPEEERGVMTELARALNGPERIARMIDLLADLSGRMRFSTEPRLLLELALVRMTRPESDLTLDALSERIERLERGGTIAPAPVVASAADVAASARANVRAVAPVTSAPTQSAPVASAPVAPQSAHTGKSAPTQSAPVEDERPCAPLGSTTDLDRRWQNAIMAMKKKKASCALFFRGTRVHEGDDGALTIMFPAGSSFMIKAARENSDIVRNAIYEVWGTQPAFSFEMSDDATDLGQISPEPAAPTSAPAPQTYVVEPPEPDDAPLPEPDEAPSNEDEFAEPRQITSKFEPVKPASTNSLEGMLAALGGTNIEEVVTSQPQEQTDEAASNNEGFMIDPEEEQTSLF